MLKRKSLSVSEIAFAVDISERLTEEYLDLYQRYNIPEYQDRLAEIVQRASREAARSVKASKKGAK
jgi:hypothetical protein